jgi:hypothetical protein
MQSSSSIQLQAKPTILTYQAYQAYQAKPTTPKTSTSQAHGHGWLGWLGWLVAISAGHNRSSPHIQRSPRSFDASR